MSLKEGASITRPPLLDGSNYSYWKTRMQVFLSALDESAWAAIENGWSRPIKVDKEGNESFKDRKEWSAAELQAFNGNSKALNTIYSAVSEGQFKIVTVCTSARDAWIALQNVHEGTSAVRVSKLQLLTTQFEDLKMDDDETIEVFYEKLRDIANKAFHLGKTYSELKLIRKTLRSLPDRFVPKVAAIEEARDLSTMRLDELIGSLQTFEMNLLQGRRDRGLALKAKCVVEDDVKVEGSLFRDDDVALLTKNFNKMLKRVGNRSQGYRGRNSTPRPHENTTVKSPVREDLKKNGERIQCYECEGFGHIQADCINTVRKQKGKSFAITWSDDSSDDCGNEDKMVSNFVAFPAICNVDSDSCNSGSVNANVITAVMTCGSESCSEVDSDADMSDEDMLASYQLMFNKWTQVRDDNMSLKINVKKLTEEKELVVSECSCVQEQLVKLESSLRSTLLRAEKAEGILNKMNAGKASLDDLLSMGKAAGDRHGLGYVDVSDPICSTSHNVQFVPESGFLCQDNVVNQKRKKTGNVKRSMVCDYCLKTGHSQKNCFKRLRHHKKERKIGTMHQCISSVACSSPNRRRIKKCWVKKGEVPTVAVKKSPFVSTTVMTRGLTTMKGYGFGDHYDSTHDEWLKKMLIDFGIHPNGRRFMS